MIILLLSSPLIAPLAVLATLLAALQGLPIFYTQTRVGKDGKLFTIYKFRTMKGNAEPNGPQFAERNDSRCTRIGRWLRKSGLDELPQIINVLKGDMAIVGPRPERPEFYERGVYPGHYRRRLAVKPGIFGYAQMRNAREPSEKLALDINYIAYRNKGGWTWRKDLQIISTCIWRSLRLQW